jgi:hypothetical protein
VNYVTHHHGTFACSVCGVALNASEGADNSAPTDGDMTICAECGALQIFQGSPPTTLRPASQDEVDLFLRLRGNQLTTMIQDAPKYAKRNQGS